MDEEALAASQSNSRDHILAKLPQGIENVIGKTDGIDYLAARYRIAIARIILQDAPGHYLR